MENFSEPKMRYRLGLDLGTSSLGWAMLRLDENNQPCAVIKAGVRIFSDGRDPKTQESLAVQRRLARQQRRTRDRALRRKNRLIKDLVELGFFPADQTTRKALEQLDPYRLRAEGLVRQLQPEEFARALFHLAKRRGFKSNRKMDSKDSEASTMKKAIADTRSKLKMDNCRTIGEWLFKRLSQGHGARARLREISKKSDSGRETKLKIYDLYLDRSMVMDEFEQLWKVQSTFNPSLYSLSAHDRLADTIFFQRELRPVDPGRCTLIPDKPRAPLALPSQQRFRIYQEVNNLRKIDSDLNLISLTRNERDVIVNLLERKSRVTFEQLKKLIQYSGDFNLEDDRRKELKGNATSALLGKKDLLGKRWFSMDLCEQDRLVEKLLETQSEEELIDWLESELEVDGLTAERLSDLTLPSGYGSLSKDALDKILPILMNNVVTYDKAVFESGFDSHSTLTHFSRTGEILPLLPYYGEYLTRRVGFGTNDIKDPPEKRFGRISNPTVHIGLNQVRVVVNALIHRYGRPSEVIIEVARELKLSKEKKQEISRQQVDNQKRRDRIRRNIADVLGCREDWVTGRDIEKWILWEELGDNTLERRCPYSGKQISASMLLSDEVEIEHILPYARTLDNSMANKTVAIREANRIKGNRTPWEARKDFENQGWDSEEMLARADRMPKAKRFRFGKNGYEEWLKGNNDFISRALTDTQYLSIVAKEYLGLICPNTRSIPGRLTAMLREKFGLNNILGNDGLKNRNDHRHHAVDACVIAVTDQSLLQRVSTECARCREKRANRIIDRMPLPWPSYFESVKRAIESIKVSHKPDHGYQGAMHDQTARGFLLDGKTITHKLIDGRRVANVEVRTLIPITCQKASDRHGYNSDHSPRAYKGYVGNSNFCLNIYQEKSGKWSSRTISTFEAYRIVRLEGEDGLWKSAGEDGKAIVSHLMINDTVRLEIDGKRRIFLVDAINQEGVITMSPINEANVSARSRNKEDSFKYLYKKADTLRKGRAVFVNVTPDGRVRKI